VGVEGMLSQSLLEALSQVVNLTTAEHTKGP
jgi:hypothetical protein